MASDKYEISAPATQAARLLMQNYTLVPKPGCRVLPTEKNVAILIDVSTGIFRLDMLLSSEMIRTLEWKNESAFKRQLDQVRQGVQAIEMLRNRLPKFSGTADREVDMRMYRETELNVSDQQKEHSAAVSKALSEARTVQEEQEVLQKAGLIPHQNGK